MKNNSILTEKEIGMIRGKLLVNKATQKECREFLFYVDKLEGLVEEASMKDFYGTEGYKRRLGWD